jgi:hypothetical protein
MDKFLTSEFGHESPYLNALRQKIKNNEIGSYEAEIYLPYRTNEKRGTISQGGH